jgi:hypothetical protein
MLSPHIAWAATLALGYQPAPTAAHIAAPKLEASMVPGLRTV